MHLHFKNKYLDCVCVCVCTVYVCVCVRARTYKLHTLAHMSIFTKSIWKNIIYTVLHSVLSILKRVRNKCLFKLEMCICVLLLVTCTVYVSVVRERGEGGGEKVVEMDSNQQLCLTVTNL